MPEPPPAHTEPDTVAPVSASVDSVTVGAYRIPTDAPESDGTFAWDATTIVVVELGAEGVSGLGYTYGPAAIASVIDHELWPLLEGADPFAFRQTWSRMHAALRNAGQGGMGAMAIAAVDIALHDLRARILDVPLITALGRRRDRAEAYGSGGFCSYSDAQLEAQLGGWAAAGLKRVKLKVGRHPDDDLRRLEVARGAVGPDVELMVDANGAYGPRAGIAWALRFADAGVVWLEEPVTQDDLPGLADVRDRAPGPLAVASGEYSWSRVDTARLLEAEAVDVVQADVTRCCGLTELLRIDALCAAAHRPLSLHCAPAISAHAAGALEQYLHLEYFHDHVRIESMLFDGCPPLRGGALVPDPARRGHGLSFRRAAAAALQVA